MGFKQILLILPPVFWPKMPPIGLGYLQSYLSQNGIGSEILDLNNIFYNLVDNHLKKEWLISCNLCLEKNILKLIQNNQYRKYCEVINKILEFDVIGFSCFKSNFQAALEIIRVIKSQRKDLKIILGGPEITRQFFEGKGRFDQEITRLVDLLVVGEGERPLYDYLSGRRITGKISTFAQVESLSELTFPKYRGVDFNLYPRKDTLSVQFSRGCIRKCSFCSERLLYQGFRVREVNSVIDEIRYHKKNNRINYFVFFDSLINGDLVQLEILCDEIINNFGTINWEAQIAVRDDMREEIFAKMKKSGCYNLFVGLESGSDRTLKRMNKGFTVEQAADF
ncbi:MAG: radical SAM protein, partial [Candidatus Omnitrophota bacterium]